MIPLRITPMELRKLFLIGIYGLSFWFLYSGITQMIQTNFNLDPFRMATIGLVGILTIIGLIKFNPVFS